MKLLAVDPGDKSGWAAWDMETNKPINFGQATLSEMSDLLNAIKPEEYAVFVVEDFILFRQKAQAQVGSRFAASQVIGILRHYARTHDIKLVMQKPENKDAGAKFTQVFPPKNHAESHRFDAYNHGAFYLVKNNKMKTALEVHGL